MNLFINSNLLPSTGNIKEKKTEVIVGLVRLNVFVLETLLMYKIILPFRAIFCHKDVLEITFPDKIKIHVKMQI